MIKNAWTQLVKHHASKARRFGIVLIIFGFFLPSFLYPFTTLNRDAYIWRLAAITHGTSFSPRLNELQIVFDDVTVPYHYVIAIGIISFFAGIALLVFTGGISNKTNKKSKEHNQITQRESEWTPEQIIELAKRQKQSILLFSLLFLPSLLSFPAVFLPLPEIVLVTLLVIIKAMPSVMGILLIYFVFRLVQAIHPSRQWIYRILSLIAVINLFVLLYLNAKATKILKANGVKVGLIGARSSDLKKIKGGAL